MLSVRGARLKGSVSSLNKCFCSQSQSKESARQAAEHEQRHLDDVVHNIAAAWQPDGFVHERAHDGVEKFVCVLD